MKKGLSKTETKKEIENFFLKIKEKTPKQIKKIKKLGMRFNISLKEKRKLFCSKCYSVYDKPKIRIRKKFKRVICESCGNKSKWKLK